MIYFVESSRCLTCVWRAQLLRQASWMQGTYDIKAHCASDVHKVIKTKMVFICTKEILLGVPWVSVKADVLTFSQRTLFGRSILGVG